MDHHSKFPLAPIPPFFRIHTFSLRFLCAILLAFSPHIADAKGANRNPSAVNEFKRGNPCPTNGNKRGACPGYEVDHLRPLKCGGADVPWNMQWLTIREHREKTKREAKSCRNGTSVPE